MTHTIDQSWSSSDCSRLLLASSIATVAVQSVDQIIHSTCISISRQRLLVDRKLSARDWSCISTFERMQPLSYVGTTQTQTPRWTIPIRIVGRETQAVLPTHRRIPEAQECGVLSLLADCGCEPSFEGDLECLACPRSTKSNVLSVKIKSTKPMKRDWPPLMITSPFIAISLPMCYSSRGYRRNQSLRSSLTISWTLLSFWVPSSIMWDKYHDRLLSMLKSVRGRINWRRTDFVSKSSWAHRTEFGGWLTRISHLLMAIEASTPGGEGLDERVWAQRFDLKIYRRSGSLAQIPSSWMRVRTICPRTNRKSSAQEIETYDIITLRIERF